MPDDRLPPAADRDESAPPTASDLGDRLDKAREELLELSTRNRLLSTPRHRARSRVLEIVGEDAEALFAALVERGQALTFAFAEESTGNAAEGERGAPENDAEGDGVGDTKASADLDPPAPGNIPAPGDAPAPGNTPGNTPGNIPGTAPGVGIAIEPGSPGDTFHQHNPPHPEYAPPDDMSSPSSPIVPTDSESKSQVDTELKPEPIASVDDGEIRDDAETAGPIEPAMTLRPTDQKLQTLLPADDLQKRLLRTFYDARSSQQEQGVNTLYLAIGFLRWYEDAEADKPRDVPLLLIPCTLDRQIASPRWILTSWEVKSLRYCGEEPNEILRQSKCGQRS